MRTIRYTNRFKRDYKREKAGRYGKTLDGDLTEIARLLAADAPLLRKNFDHPLSGEWRDHRDCHVQPDLILIYRKPDDANVEFVRLDSYSELGF
jgi:mRNA interferase YafQ